MTDRRAMLAVHAVFAAAGFGFAGWIVRLPQIRINLGLAPGELGLVLLASAIGSLCTLPWSGLVVTRFGARRSIRAAAVACGIATVVIAVAQVSHVAPVVASLVVTGSAGSLWNVAMNVEGAAVEQRLGRGVMSHFHASFSIGTIAGAGFGAAMVALDVSVLVNLVAVATVETALVLIAARGLMSDEMVEALHEESPSADRRSVLHAWREPRTVLVGVFGLSAAFTEGTAHDWLGIAVVEGHRGSQIAGSLTYAAFVTSMTIGRLTAPTLLRRAGRVAGLRVLVGVALLGLGLVVFGDGPPVAAVGAVLWGFGASMGYPTGMSAAADDPKHAAARVAVVTSIGYLAFLLGPPLVGLLADEHGVRHALLAAAGLLAVGLAAAGACAPLASKAAAGRPVLVETSPDAPSTPR